MSTHKERQIVLDLLETGKIKPDDAAQLLDHRAHRGGGAVEVRHVGLHGRDPHRPGEGRRAGRRRPVRRRRQEVVDAVLVRRLAGGRAGPHHRGQDRLDRA